MTREFNPFDTTRNLSPYNLDDVADVNEYFDTHPSAMSRLGNRTFNPYDLNDVADIDLFIEAWKEKKLLEQTAIRKPPTKGILAGPKKERRKILKYDPSYDIKP